MIDMQNVCHVLEKQEECSFLRTIIVLKGKVQENIS